MRVFVLGSILLLAACGRDTASDPTAQAKTEPQATELRDAVKAPLDKARAAEQLLERSTDATDKALEDVDG